VKAAAQGFGAHQFDSVRVAASIPAFMLPARALTYSLDRTLTPQGHETRAVFGSYGRTRAWVGGGMGPFAEGRVG
jgi:hypothetical protein